MDLSELEMLEGWNGEALAALIRSKSDHLTAPAFLFLGRREAGLLTEHLAKVFGEEAVATLHDTYYMGLEVIEIDHESYVAVGGCKTVRTLQDPIARRPAWRERETEAGWQFRM